MSAPRHRGAACRAQQPGVQRAALNALRMLPTVCAGADYTIRPLAEGLPIRR